MRHAILAGDFSKMFLLIVSGGVALLSFSTAERGSCEEYRERSGSVSSHWVAGAFEFLMFAAKSSDVCVSRKSRAFGSHVLSKCVV